jgi:hypothetical protein
MPIESVSIVTHTRTVAARLPVKVSKPARTEGTEHLPNARLVLGVLERRSQLIVVDERRRVPSIRRKTPPLGPRSSVLQAQCAPEPPMINSPAGLPGT